MPPKYSLCSKCRGYYWNLLAEELIIFIIINLMNIVQCAYANNACGIFTFNYLPVMHYAVNRLVGTDMTLTMQFE